MRFSIITPTHDIRHLRETYTSVQAQTCQDYEWCLLLNGVVRQEHLPADMLADPKVKVFQFTGDNEADRKIGELKKACCSRATGDAFVELDHDDMLTPDALEQLAGCLDRGAGFVFSDAAVFEDVTGTARLFDAAHGWETYPLHVYGRDFIATRSFAVTPRSLCDIFYAPDHVRCWSRKAYYAVGGHDPALSVGDDHDLICRTYLAGVAFEHTQKTAYLYRIHPKNTFRQRQQAVINQSTLNKSKYLHRLVDEWLRRTGLRYFDIKREDVRELLDDEFADAPIGLAAADPDSVGAIRCYDVLQWFSYEEAAKLLSRLYSVMAPGGFVCLSTPSTDGRRAFMPGYRSHWNSQSFSAFCDRSLLSIWPNYAGRYQLVFARDLPKTKEDRVNQFLCAYADLCCIKGQRQPGIVRC